MDINSLFIKISENLGLGKIVDGPEEVIGGLTHRMFRLFTDKGKYIIKLLNPNIMKKATALDNFTKAERYEDVFKENNIKAIYSIKFNNKKMQEIDGQYFYVFKWDDGKYLNYEEITEDHCRKIGKALAKIHNIDLIKKKYVSKINIDFKYYIDLAKKMKSPIYDLLFDKLDILNNYIDNANKSLKKIPSYYSLCHNDLDSVNVLWLDNDYKIVDLESLDYNNPYIEIYETALCWSGYKTCNINFKLFNAVFESYFKNSKLDKNIDWESIYYTDNERLEWLEFNIKRSLMIDCDTKEEQEIGLNEVKKVIKYVTYYNKMKDKIINNIKKLI